jgi:hypothetical protein
MIKDEIEPERFAFTNQMREQNKNYYLLQALKYKEKK